MRDTNRPFEFPAAHSPFHGRRGAKPRSLQTSWWARACAALMLCAATAIASPAQTFTSLFNFDNTDGYYPYAGLVQATDGNLYGTTIYGGAKTNCQFVIGCGTAFKMTPSGTLTMLYSFCSQNDCTDGSAPQAALVQATDGSFYGTTEFGGVNDSCEFFSAPSGCGTVFKMTPSGALTTVYSFCAQSGCTDGREPSAGLVEGTDGNFYGTTFGGGANVNCYLGNSSGCGTVFKITPGGTLTTLYSFCSVLENYVCTDGAEPQAALVRATDGNFYGTTAAGGGVFNFGGTVFKITPSGTLTTLYSFCLQGCGTGEDPAALIQGTDGNFYGTTSAGGLDVCIPMPGCGTVFKITPSGTLTAVHSFDGTDGAVPTAGLVQGTNGNLYGTTEFGGANGAGTIFGTTPSGTLTTLYSFCSQSGCTDGEYPQAGLVQDTNGSFYGTTPVAGVDGYGTVFSLSVSLRPFVETQPAAGKVGRAVRIVGTNLTGATSVTFDGTPAVFKVFSSSLIGTIVPAGATSGKVRVTTPSGTLSSNVPFRVIP